MFSRVFPSASMMAYKQRRHRPERDSSRLHLPRALLSRESLNSSSPALFTQNLRLMRERSSGRYVVLLQDNGPRGGRRPMMLFGAEKKSERRRKNGTTRSRRRCDWESLSLSLLLLRKNEHVLSSTAANLRCFIMNSDAILMLLAGRPRQGHSWDVKLSTRHVQTSRKNSEWKAERREWENCLIDRERLDVVGKCFE